MAILLLATQTYAGYLEKLSWAGLYSVAVPAALMSLQETKSDWKRSHGWRSRLKKFNTKKRGKKEPAVIESDVWAPCLQLCPTYSVHHLFKAFLTQKGIFNDTEKNPPEVEAQAPLPWINGIQISHKRLNYTGRIFLPFLNHMWQNLEVIFLTVESYWTEQFSKKYHQGYPSTRIQRISRASLTEGVKLFCNNATDHSLQQTEDTF